ncbi:Trk system potassium uptake protein [uncultured Gammaproteobacteria bacterium]
MIVRDEIVPVFHIVGVVLSILGVGMLLPCLVDLLNDDPDWSAFGGAAVLTLAVSGGMFLATADKITRFTIRQTFLLTTLSWACAAGVGALPLMLSALRLNFTDAYFEAMSGLTTTGSTVIAGLNHAPLGVLLWRAQLNWFGGIGVIIMAIAILPVLRVGGMQMFRTESADKNDRPFATVKDTAGAIAITYLVLTIISLVMFWSVGMSWFDALCHAMAAISTGGFSTKDESLAFFHSNAVLWVATATIIAGSMPLTYYVRLLRNFRTTLLADTQVLLMWSVLLVASVAMSAWVYQVVHLPLWDAISHATLNTVSIILDCGLISADYSQWGGFAVTAFFFFYFIGGCTGSASGSIKIFRWQILFKAMANQMTRMLQPHRVIRPIYNGKVVDHDVIDSVVNFVIAYIECYALLTLALAAFGLDFLSAASGVASALSGAGPGLGPVIGPGHTFGSLPEGGKWVLSFAMILGRLEVFTVLVLLAPTFWRD